MKNYRMDESLNLIGAFWPPDKPDSVTTGALSMLDGRLHLFVSPTFKKMTPDEVTEAMRIAGTTRPARRMDALVGQTKDGPCTLIYLVETLSDGVVDFSKNLQLAGDRWRISSAVMGLQIDSAKSESIDAAAFYFTSIHRWLPSATRMTLNKEGRSYDMPSRAVQLFRLESRALEAEVICEIFPGETPTKSVPRIRITPSKPKSLEWFAPIAARLENLLTLFMGTSVSAKSLQLFQGEKKDGWFINNRKRIRSEKPSFQAWVPYTRLGVALENWFSVPDEQRPVETTVLGMVRKSTLFIETEFLALAQALEGFGRLRFEGGLIPKPDFKLGLTKLRKTLAELWGESEIAKRCNEALSNANESSYGYRLGQTYDLLTAEFATNLLGERSRFLQKVVQTRNYFTHLGISKKEAVVDGGRELFLLNQQLHAFLRCVMLIDLGIPETELRDPVLYQANRWKAL